MFLRVIVMAIALSAILVPVGYSDSDTDWDCVGQVMESLQSAIDRQLSERSLKRRIAGFDRCFGVGHSESSEQTAMTSEIPSDWNSAAIGNLVRRNAEDVRIIDLEISDSATTIAYDLRPWPFVPNEDIAEEVAFKLICGIRQQMEIPNTLEMIGHSHYIGDDGERFKAPSVEIHIGASDANSIECEGREWDVSWGRIASHYESHPVPRGAKTDYGDE